MSYARFSDGDVYVFWSSQGLECCSCKLTEGNKVSPKWYFARWVLQWIGLLENIIGIITLGFKRPSWELKLWFGWEWAINPNGPKSVVFDNPVEMLGHLLKHKKAGHIVPRYATKRLRQEALEWR